MQVVRRLVADLDIPVAIIGCPTVREEDGLAMSSRNLRLSASERAIAPILARQLFQAADKIVAGEPIAQCLNRARSCILAQGFQSVEYLELCDEYKLIPLVKADQPTRILSAVWLGGIRLIDNVIVTKTEASK